MANVSSCLCQKILRQCLHLVRSNHSLSNQCVTRGNIWRKHIKSYSTSLAPQPNFGILFDIDGVLVRGRKVLPEAVAAFRDFLIDADNKFRVPVVFVTNAGNSLRQVKAQQLSSYLGVQISAEQVIMSHSPLKMFQQFQDKHVLVSGQGPVKDIGKFLGFSNITTVDQFRAHFPLLDMVDHKRRKSPPCAFEPYFPKVDALVLFGEPVRWETSLQLILDCLLTNGQPSTSPSIIPYPHLPILACNMDLLWMAEAPMPRLGHGSFLLCLESLYQKITGRPLKYTVITGKPSEITYHHAEHVATQIASSMGLESTPRTLYAIGDNPMTDIYGANLYNRYLASKPINVLKTGLKTKLTASQGKKPTTVTTSLATHHPGEVPADHLLEKCAETMESVLVCTGVYCETRHKHMVGVDHGHRDYSYDVELARPSLTVDNVYQAIESIYEREGFK